MPGQMAMPALAALFPGPCPAEPESPAGPQAGGTQLTIHGQRLQTGGQHPRLCGQPALPYVSGSCFQLVAASWGAPNGPRSGIQCGGGEVSALGGEAKWVCSDRLAGQGSNPRCEPLPSLQPRAGVS